MEPLSLSHSRASANEPTYTSPLRLARHLNHHKSLRYQEPIIEPQLTNTCVPIASAKVSVKQTCSSAIVIEEDREEINLRASHKETRQRGAS